MKVWRSPVFYFGILLAVAVAGLLAAPFIIDWNGYRSDLEAYGRKLTGRAVSIEGPISARLFPWPRLTAEGLAIANPPGLEQRDFATAERITIRMTLAGLLQGGIDVESIEIAEPALHLERLPTGEGNWHFTPSADLIRSDILSRVKLDQITFAGGTVNFRDRRRGETMTLNDVTATLASPGVAGPWRLRGQALYSDRAFDIGITTGTYAEGRPFRFGVRIAAADGSGHVFGFDGAQQGGTAEGQLRIEPQSSGEGKGDAEGRLRPLVLAAKVKGDFDRVELSGIEISRHEAKNGGAIATGSASLKLGRHIEAAFDLSAAMLDLDELAGAKSRNVLREAGSLAVADGLLAMLPADMSLSGRLQVTALKTGGQNLDSVSLALEADRGGLRINRFSAGLPGRSDMLFSGNYFPGGAGGELSGDLALETNDLRDLTLWLWHEGREALAPLWTGSRGRLKMQTAISLTPSRVRLTGAEFELDGERGSGTIAVTWAGRGAADISLEGGRFDFDAYAPQGVPAFSAAVREGIGGIAAFVLPRPDAPDLRLRFKAGELLLNGVTARDVSLDLQSGANGLDLRALDVGSVGGARLAATGLILDSGQGADGSIGVEVTAEDPSELIRLAGLAQEGRLPDWAMGLGRTALKGHVAVSPVEQGPELRFGVNGTAGDLTLSASGASSAGGALSAVLKLDAPQSRRILSLLGLSPQGESEVPGSLQVKGAGSLRDGISAEATLQAYNARLDYRGTAKPWAEGYGIDGKLSLRATDAAPLIAATGIPATPAPAVLVADAAVGFTEGAWRLSGITGRYGADPFSGSISLTPAGGFEARLVTGALRLSHVLAATFLEWTGTEPGLESAFAARLPFGLTGEVWIEPSSLEVHPHFRARDASVGIAAKPGEIRLAMAGKDEEGRDAQIEIGSAGEGPERQLTGRLTIPVDLSRQLALADGSAVAEGQGVVEIDVESEGRSPGAALAAARGRGSYEFDGVRLLALSPATFAAALSEAKDAAGIEKAFAALKSGEGLQIGAVSGPVSIASGVVSFAPLKHQGDEADVEVKTVAELALGEIDVEAALRFKFRPDLPPMSVSYSGPPMALARGENVSELATSLGVTIMQEGIDELERLQKEQQRLAELEEKQRLEDEARLQAYYAQRDELLLRRRELKVHAEMVVAEAERLRRQIESERAANAEINKAEIRQRAREVRLWRRLMQQSAAEPGNAVTSAPKPAPEKPARPRQTRRPQAPGPIILAKPPGAPVIVSPPPGSSPSQ
ncbi:AsmA family protein [Aestuariivirga sp.]|uniref:AsmA family protein n=1 Tax=Aestuariivirga sp. TaxID=2650926 RepID=UPI00391DACB1